MRVGVVGTKWGLMHVGAFRAAGAEVTGLCGRDIDSTVEVARRERIPFATTSVAELAQHADIIAVASPDTLHHVHAAEAIAAGCHVLCEKPLARSAADARDLARRAAEAPGLVCATAFAYRHLAAMRGLREWVRGAGGARLLSAVVRNSFAGADGTNLLRDGAHHASSGDFGAASHIIDAALWLMDAEPASVSAQLQGRPVHSVSLRIGLGDARVLAIDHIAVPEPGIDGRWTLVGDGWEARLRGGYAPARGGWAIGPGEAFRDGAWREVSPRMEPGDGRPDPWFSAHVEAARAFLAAVRRGGLAPEDGLADFAAGARVQSIIEAAIASDAAHGAPKTVGGGPA